MKSFACAVEEAKKRYPLYGAGPHLQRQTPGANLRFGGKTSFLNADHP
jgi:hypothetical protein